MDLEDKNFINLSVICTSGLIFSFTWLIFLTSFILVTTAVITENTYKKGNVKIVQSEDHRTVKLIKLRLWKLSVASLYSARLFRIKKNVAVSELR